MRLKNPKCFISRNVKASDGTILNCRNHSEFKLQDNLVLDMDIKDIFMRNTDPNNEISGGGGGDKYSGKSNMRTL